MSGRIAGIVLWLVAAVATSAQAQTVEYLHTDALGSVVAVTDANRNVIERREYEPYGWQLTPAVSNGPGYTGHVQDAATGLVYMQQRYYDAQIGRFLSMDPVTANSGTGANFNRYWYADNNPYTFIDPTGRCTGSRIENKDGTCVSSGGNTTATYGARQSAGDGGQIRLAQAVPPLIAVRATPTLEPLVKPTAGVPASSALSQAVRQTLRNSQDRAAAAARELQKIEQSYRDLKPETRTPENLPRLPGMSERPSLPESRWYKVLDGVKEIFKIFNDVDLGAAPVTLPNPAPASQGGVAPQPEMTWAEACQVVGCA
jgi:RHS repeat-associated protein